MRRRSTGAIAMLALCLAPALPASAQALFTDVSSDVGLGGVSGRNFAFVDYNGDGYPDVLVGCSKLFQNSGPPDYTFTDVTATAGLAGNHGTYADIDNDGDLDLYCAGRDQNARLWENNGDGTFTDISDFDGNGSRDMTVDSPSLAGAWADYDLDSFVDMYVGNYERTGNADCDVDTLWRNDGDNTFTDVTASSDVQAAETAIVNADPGMCARGITWGDYNDDGYPDVYVSNYRLDQNMLLENDGDGTFTDVAVARDADGTRDGDSWGHTLGAEFFDMDNDADLDLYAGSLAHWWGSCIDHDISYLFENGGSGAAYGFTDTRSTSGMRPFSVDCFDPENDWEEAGPGWADWDNDTIPDLYATQFYPFRAHWSTLYRGTGAGQFVDVSDPGNGDCEDPAAPGDPNPINFDVGPTCLKRWYGWNAAWADYDRDGDLDLLASGNTRFNQCDVVPKPAECGAADPANRDSWPQPSFIWLFRNETGNQNNWVHLRLVGSVGNRAAIGARVTLALSGTTMLREVSGGHGYHSAQHDLPVEFGLGTAAQADSITIRWPTPGLPTTNVTGVAANQRLVAYESGAAVSRGEDPSSLASYAVVEFFPWTDPEPVLDTAVPSKFYLLDDAHADLRVDKDPGATSVRLSVVN
jgi:hypothetical protein